jgi:hypothetical protein
MGEEDVYETIGDEICSDSGGTVVVVLDSENKFHVCPQRDLFDSFREVFSGTVTLADGSTLSVIGIGMVRFQMCDVMICTIIDIRYVLDAWRGLMSLSELHSRRYKLRIHVGFMEVLRCDIIVIRSTRRGGLFEMVNTVESTSTVVPADTPTCRVVGGDDMIGCSGATTIETCHMAVSIIAQLSGQRVVEGGGLAVWILLDTLRPVEVGIDMWWVMLHRTLDLYGHGPYTHV